MLERAFQEPKFRVSCLGRFKLMEADSGTDMTPASRKARALIGYLCIVRRPVGRERLASLLWGDRGDEQARASLRQAIYELRSMLAGNHLLKMERDTVAIGDDVSTDAAVILAAAESGNLQQLSVALSEWRGDFFEDLPSIDESFDTWLQSERHRVQQSLVDAAAEAAKAGMARGEVDAARKIVALLQQRDGTNEIVLRLGLELDHLAGDSAALRRRYERFREQLKAELDATPAAETQRLFQELIARSPRSADSVAFDSRNTVANRAREYAQQDETRAARSAGPSVTQSTADPDTEARGSRPPVQSTRRIAIVGAVFALAALCALAWVIWSPLYRTAPSSNFANGPSTLGAERLLLTMDPYSGHQEDQTAAIEAAARAAAQRTLERDPNDGQALGVLAVLTPSIRLQEIDRLFERALRSEPNNAQLLNWHGRFLIMVGRNHEALEELTRAYERDHATPSIASNLALAFMLTNRFEEAREILDLGRDDGLGDELFPLRVKYFLYRRDWFGLANDLRALPRNLTPTRNALFRLCRETAIAFVTREADKSGRLRARWRTEALVDPDDAVQFLSALGDGDGAFLVVQSAEKSRQNRDLLTEPAWEALFTPDLAALRRDPRVAALFVQWGLTDYWRRANHWPDFMR